MRCCRSAASRAGGSGSALHDGCLEALPAASGPRCDRCWRPLGAHETAERVASLCARCAEGGTDAPAFDALRAPFRFEGFARRALLEAKFRGVTAHLAPLGRAAAAVVPPEWAPDAVVAVPLARGRERRRGYNQAHIAARAVAEALGVPLEERLVRRVRETPPQAALDAAARASNLRDAFAATRAAPHRVLVVDDVTTTGATLDAVARALRSAGARQVYVLALARED